MAEDMGAIYAEFRLRLDELRRDISQAEEELEKLEQPARGVGDAWIAAGFGIMKLGGILTAALTVPLIGIGRAVVDTAADFEFAMAEVSAISGAVGEDLEDLSGVARHLGATTRYSAVEAASGMTMLARAGWEVNEIMTAMPGLLDLAAAGNVELAIAADIVSDVMQAFGEDADQAGRYADAFAEAAASANTNVEMLGQAMAYAAPAAAAAGFSFEETAASLMAMADAGVKSTRAGTTMDSILRELRQNVRDGVLDFGEFEVAVYDQEGAMRSFFDILGDIETGISGMTTEQRDAAIQMNFTTRSLRGLNILLGRGTDELRDLEGGLLNAEGAAERMADTMMDTLTGATIELRSALEGLRISFGEILIPLVRSAVDTITDLVRWFEGLSRETKELIVNIALVAAALGPVITGFGALVTGIGMLIKHWSTIVGFFAAFGPKALLVVGAIAGIAAIVYGLIEAYERWNQEQRTLEDTISESMDRITGDYARQISEQRAQQAERNVEQVRMEIETLIAMGDAVEQSELDAKWEELHQSILRAQRARSTAMIFAEHDLLNQLREITEEELPELRDAIAGYLEEIEVYYKGHVQSVVQEAVLLREFGYISQETMLMVRDYVSEYMEEARLAMSHELQRMMHDSQADLISMGQIYDHSLEDLTKFSEHHGKSAVSALVDNLDELPPEMREKAEAAISAYSIATLRGFEASNEETRQAMLGLLDILDEIDVDFMDGGERIGSDFLEGLSISMGDLDAEWIKAFRDADLDNLTSEELQNIIQATKAIADAELNPAMTAIAEDALKSFQTGTEEGQENAIKAMTTLLNMVEEEVFNIDVDLSGIGAMIPGTLADGMEDLTQQDRIYREGQRIGEKAIDGVADMIEYKSPPRVFYDMGVSIPTAIADGMRDASADIVGVASGIADNIMDQFRGINIDFEGVGRDLSTQLTEALTSGMERTASEVERIASNLFTTIVDGISSAISRIPTKIDAPLQETVGRLEVWSGDVVDIGDSTSRMFVDAVEVPLKDLSGTVDELLRDTIYDMRRWSSDAVRIFRDTGINMVREFIDALRRLPQEVRRILEEVAREILRSSSRLQTLARQAASRMVQGFYQGAGIRSPSDIERAMEQILSETTRMMDELVSVTRDGAREFNMEADKISTGIDDPTVMIGDRRSTYTDTLEVKDENLLKAILALSKAIMSIGDGREDKETVIEMDGVKVGRIVKEHLDNERIRTADI